MRRREKDGREFHRSTQARSVRASCACTYGLCSGADSREVSRAAPPPLGDLEGPGDSQ